MQHPARMLPGGRRFFFPRRLSCFWTWKPEKFQVAYQVFLDTAALKFLKLSWRFVRTTQMWSAISNYRRNGVGGCCSSKWQTPLLAVLVSMSWKARMSTASLARRVWSLAPVNAGAEETKITVSLTFSAEQSQLFSALSWATPWLHTLLRSGAVTGWWCCHLPRWPRNVDLILCVKEGGHRDCSWSVLASSPRFQHYRGQPPASLWVRPGHQAEKVWSYGSSHLILKEKSVPSCPWSL